MEESAGHLQGHRHCRGRGGHHFPSKTSAHPSVHQLPEQKQPARPPAGRGCLAVEGGHRAGHQRDIPWVLQLTVSGPQEDGRSSSGHRPFHSQPPHGSSTLYDGDAGIHPFSHQKSRVDSVHRHLQRISTCPDAPSRLEVSAICGQQASLPVHLPTLRIGNITSQVHQALTTSRSTVKARRCEATIYLDDWLIHADSPEQAQLHAQMTISVLQFLGWIINYEKSDLTPSQDFQFIRMQFNTQFTVAAQWRPYRRCVSKSSPFINTGWPTQTSQPAICTDYWACWCSWLHWYNGEDSVFVQSRGRLPQHGARGLGAGPTGSQFLSGFCRAAQNEEIFSKPCSPPLSWLRHIWIASLPNFTKFE